jgi:ribosomal protein S18 acetylase RimI-like enzyme
MADIRLRACGPDDLAAAEALLDAELGGRRQARLGEVVDVLDAPGLVAWGGNTLAGVATWDGGSPRAELLAMAVARSHQGHGLGARLVEAVVEEAVSAGCSTLFLVTTNDNLDALRLYQRHGFRLTAIRLGAVDEARRELKPTIPTTGQHGIPLHDELVLERDLR